MFQVIITGNRQKVIGSITQELQFKKLMTSMEISKSSRPSKMYFQKFQNCLLIKPKIFTSIGPEMILIRIFWMKIREEMETQVTYVA